ncbi:MAG: hypothetical protein WBE02_05435, partial [Bradyrhizobium sp.]
RIGDADRVTSFHLMAVERKGSLVDPKLPEHAGRLFWPWSDRVVSGFTPIVCAAPVTVEWYAGLGSQVLKQKNRGEAA